MDSGALARVWAPCVKGLSPTCLGFPRGLYNMGEGSEGILANLADLWGLSLFALCLNQSER